jgi:hypothetical protein
MDITEADALKIGGLWLDYWRRKTMGQRDSVMIQIEGVDGSTPRLVARADLIDTLAEMAQSDLRRAHSELGIDTFSTDRLQYVRMEARGLIALLEQHTRAVNALQALLAFRDPDELVEAHMP